MKPKKKNKTPLQIALGRLNKLSGLDFKLTTTESWVYLEPDLRLELGDAVISPKPLQEADMLVFITGVASGVIVSKKSVGSQGVA